MTQEVFNSADNIQVPHNISVWFQKDWTGNYIELGDCLVNSVSVSPEYQEFRSYRNGINALRKRVLSARNGSVSLTLNEPNIVNLQRFVLGGTISTGQTTTVYDAQHLEVDSDGTGVFIDLADAGETDFGSITVTALYAQTDVQETTNLISANILPDTDGKVRFDATDTGIDDGDTVYVKYTVAMTSLYKSEIMGSTNSVIEGRIQIQARNPKGGVVQIWELSGANISASGDLSYGLTDMQNIPLSISMQEHGGTLGYVYAK